MARVVRAIVEAHILREADRAKKHEAQHERDESGGEALAEREGGDGRNRSAIHVTPTVFTLKMGSQARLRLAGLLARGSLRFPAFPG
jgi:hypothetical protein